MASFRRRGPYLDWHSAHLNALGAHAEEWVRAGFPAIQRRNSEGGGGGVFFSFGSAQRRRLFSSRLIQYCGEKKSGMRLGRVCFAG